MRFDFTTTNYFVDGGLARLAATFPLLRHDPGPTCLAVRGHEHVPEIIIVSVADCKVDRVGPFTATSAASAASHTIASPGTRFAGRIPDNMHALREVLIHSASPED